MANNEINNLLTLFNSILGKSVEFNKDKERYNKEFYLEIDSLETTTIRTLDDKPYGRYIITGNITHNFRKTDEMGFFQERKFTFYEDVKRYIKSDEVKLELLEITTSNELCDMNFYYVSNIVNLDSKKYDKIQEITEIKIESNPISRFKIQLSKFFKK